MYNWKRFWCPHTGNIRLDYSGFLYDPESEDSRYIKSDVVGFKDISHIGCLVLLGEPGIGKTTVAKEEYKEVCKQVCESEDTCLWFNLGDYDSDDNLCEAIFRNKTFEDWLRGNHKLYLFLDSLDEGLLSIKILVRILKRNIENLPSDRLYLRITCRTSVWSESSSLEEKLKEKWKKANTGIYELAPLRRIDVIEAASANSLDCDGFLKEIIEREATPLAIQPITLKFLISTYRKNGKFPPSQKELYEQGLLQLCEEINPDRRESGNTGKLSSHQRLVLASRIAALMIFANRTAIWISPEIIDIPNSDIAIRDFCVGKESINQQEFIIDESCIREVLSVTGLFSSRGTNRMGFAHQTYAEFLAAWYLFHHDIPLIQVMSLIVSPEDPERKLVPQLHETAAWLASMRIDILQEIIKTDPDVLLRSDIPTDAELRANIVENLLNHYNDGKLFNRDFGSYLKYKKLKHPGLAEQLRPYIQGSDKKNEARYEAIDIAEVCEVSELQEDLVTLVFNSSQDIRMRANAANAISLIGDLNTRLKLKPLAISQIQEDEDDQLKGYSLRAVGVENLEPEELFNAITPPQKKNFSGGYRMFLNYEIVPKLQPHSLAFALNWIETQGIRCFGYPFEQLADEIILKAWENLDIPGVVENFVKIARLQWKNHQSLITHDNSIKHKFKFQLFDNDEKRRKLIEKAVLIIVAEQEEEPNCLLSSIPSTENILLRKDIFWMIEKIKSTESEQQQRIWAQLIYWNFYIQNQDAKEIDAILIATQTNDILRNQFAFYCEAIDLNSAEAKRLKANHLRVQEFDNRRQETSLLEPPPKERVLISLERLESGILDAWWELNMEMSLKIDSQYYENELEIDLTQFPGWQEADITTRNRIINGTKKYIHEQTQINYDWIDTDNFDEPALAGCKALYLLLKESPEFINSISVEIWQRWAPVIIAFPNSHQVENTYLDLIKLAYLNAPNESINTLMLIIDKRDRKYNSILFIINRFDKCWDKRLEVAILEKLKDKKLKFTCMGELLEELLKRGCREARDFANSFIIFPLPSIKKEYEEVIIASTALVKNSDPTSWSIIWSVVQQDIEFARRVFEDVANCYSHGIDLNITEKQQADFYIWLVRQYPHNEDPVFTDVHFVDTREAVGTFRDSVLAQLREKGTSQACAEIQRIAKEFPELKWLKNTLLNAQNNTRRKTWKSPKPAEILQLVNNKEKRLVQDGDELLEVLLESLQQLQATLQGQTPAVIDLWNEIKWGQIKSLANSLLRTLKKQFNLDITAKIDVWNKVNWKSISGNASYIPKDENRFSDYIARYLNSNLKETGVIVNREVEIRRGERTDIQVDAVKKKANGEVYDSVTAIIEVKGCWNEELDSAMQIQLVNRYLKDNTCQHGIYLIGWFNCEQWDSSDYRKSKAPKISIDEAREKYEKQAEQLSQSSVKAKAFVLNTTLREQPKL
jgi:predicted NACHT family NTPase